MSAKGSQKTTESKKNRYECIHCGDVVFQQTPGSPFRDPDCTNRYGHDYE